MKLKPILFVLVGSMIGVGSAHAVVTPIAGDVPQAAFLMTNYGMNPHGHHHAVKALSKHSAVKEKASKSSGKKK